MPRVNVNPGGQSFAVEGADTLLEAALSAGLAVPYGCSSGVCGECRARVISGRVEKVRHHDFAFTEAEKLQGYALMCCTTALTDVTLEAVLAHEAADIPRQRVGAHVRRMDRLSGDVMLLELVTSRTSRLRFLAGQDAVVTLGDASANLPIASCPCEERRLHFHLRRDAGGALSAYAFDRLRVGEAAAIDGPIGDFTLREDGTRPLVFIAWGWQGFAPVKSVIEHALAQDTASSIDLVWIAADAAEHYHPKLCRSWAEALDDFSYSPIVTQARPYDALAQALTGLDSAPARDFYVAGGAEEVAATRAFLIERKLPPSHIVTWTPH